MSLRHQQIPLCDGKYRDRQWVTLACFDKFSFERTTPNLPAGIEWSGSPSTDKDTMAPSVFIPLLFDTLKRYVALSATELVTCMADLAP